jgi:hypothetical protein
MKNENNSQNKNACFPVVGGTANNRETDLEINRTMKGNFCEVKFKGGKPYKVECITNIAMKAYLGGEIITKEEYEKY